MALYFYVLFWHILRRGPSLFHFVRFQSKGKFTRKAIMWTMLRQVRFHEVLWLCLRLSNLGASLKQIIGAFSTLSNICNTAFLWKSLTAKINQLFLKKIHHSRLTCFQIHFWKEILSNLNKQQSLLIYRKPKFCWAVLTPETYINMFWYEKQPFIYCSKSSIKTLKQVPKALL